MSAPYFGSKDIDKLKANSRISLTLSHGKGDSPLYSGVKGSKNWAARIMMIKSPIRGGGLSIDREWLPRLNGARYDYNTLSVGDVVEMASDLPGPKNQRRRYFLVVEKFSINLLEASIWPNLKWAQSRQMNLTKTHQKLDTGGSQAVVTVSPPSTQAEKPPPEQISATSVLDEMRAEGALGNMTEEETERLKAYELLTKARHMVQAARSILLHREDKFLDSRRRMLEVEGLIPEGLGSDILHSINKIQKSFKTHDDYAGTPKLPESLHMRVDSKPLPPKLPASEKPEESFPTLDDFGWGEAEIKSELPKPPEPVIPEPSFVHEMEGETKDGIETEVEEARRDRDAPSLGYDDPPF